MNEAEDCLERELALANSKLAAANKELESVCQDRDRTRLAMTEATGWLKSEVYYRALEVLEKDKRRRDTFEATTHYRHEPS